MKHYFDDKGKNIQESYFSGTETEDELEQLDDTTETVNYDSQEFDTMFALSLVDADPAGTYERDFKKALKQIEILISNIKEFQKNSVPVIECYDEIWPELFPETIKLTKKFHTFIGHAPKIVFAVKSAFISRKRLLNVLSHLRLTNFDTSVEIFKRGENGEWPTIDSRSKENYANFSNNKIQTWFAVKPTNPAEVDVRFNTLMMSIYDVITMFFPVKGTYAFISEFSGGDANLMKMPAQIARLALREVEKSTRTASNTWDNEVSPEQMMKIETFIADDSIMTLSDTYYFVSDVVSYTVEPDKRKKQKMLTEAAAELAVRPRHIESWSTRKYYSRVMRTVPYWFCGNLGVFYSEVYDMEFYLLFISRRELETCPFNIYLDELTQSKVTGLTNEDYQAVL